MVAVALVAAAALVLMLQGAERRRAGLLMGGGLALLAVLILALAVDAIAGLARGLGQESPTLSVTAAVFGMPFLALVIAGWSFWFFRAIGGPPSAALEGRLIRASLVALAITVAAPFAVGAWADASLPERGYRPCPDADGRGRFRTVTWARDASLCPGEADPV